MRPGYRAFLMGTATDLPTSGLVLPKRSKTDEIFADITKWSKVISNLPH
jgi:hypothetical protein